MDKKSPTLLMKELVFLRNEAGRLHQEDIELSYAPLNESMEFKYDTGYVYENTRNRIKEIHSEELRIKSALAKFNSVTKVIGMDITIAEALVRIGQLREEIQALEYLAKQTEYKESRGSARYNESAQLSKINYNQQKVLEDLRANQKELTALQVAVDKTNLTAEVEY